MYRHRIRIKTSFILTPHHHHLNIRDRTSPTSPEFDGRGRWFRAFPPVRLPEQIQVSYIQVSRIGGGKEDTDVEEEGRAHQE